MKKIIVKCPRCGKENEVSVKNVKKLIECSHCHKQMALDLKSQKKIKWVRYIAMLLLALGFAYSMEQFSKQTGYLMVVFYIALVFFISRYVDDWCLKIGFVLFQYHYMDIDEYAKIRKPTLLEKRKKK